MFQNRKSKKRKRIAFPYYGGKNSHLNWILPLLPLCRHYIEPFGGSAAVLLNRKQSLVEVYNDLDGDVVNFFKILRDITDELIRVLKLTPYSREEFEVACQRQKNLSDLERARRFYIRARQSIAKNPASATKGSWAKSIDTSSCSMADNTSKWINGVEDLYDVAERFRPVQIEHRNAIEVIKRHDSVDSFFYCDPPYVLSTRNSKKCYGNELTDQNHQELAKVLNNVQGKVAISGYDSDLYNKLYPAIDVGGKWYKAYAPSRKIAASRGKTERTEVLWTNYDPKEIVSCAGVDGQVNENPEKSKAEVLCLAASSQSGTLPTEGQLSSEPQGHVRSIFENLISAKEVAELAGISVKTVYRYFETGVLNGRRIGPRLIKFSRKEIEEWLSSQSNRRKANGNI